MGLFNFRRNKNGQHPPSDLDGLSTYSGAENNAAHSINLNVQNNEITENGNPTESREGIQALYIFLEKNHESKGYNDALINADHTHLQQNVEALRHELKRHLKKAKTFYEDFIREINFHISSRTRIGMIDTVEELMVKKENSENHLRQILEIERESETQQGIGEGIILSYTRGFRNGLAAISHHSIINKNI